MIDWIVSMFLVLVLCIMIILTAAATAFPVLAAFHFHLTSWPWLAVAFTWAAADMVTWLRWTQQLAARWF